MDLINKLPSGYYVNDSVLYINYTEKENTVDLDEVDVIKIVKPYMIGAYTLFAVLGIAINLLLIVAIRLSPRLKSPIFQLQFALTFADIILLISHGLPEVSWFFVVGDIWIFGADGCKIIVFLQYLSAHVTMCLIVVCCGERFYAVCRPHSALWMTTRHMAGIIAVIWLVNSAVLAPLLVMSKPIEYIYPEQRSVMACRFDMVPHTKQIYLTVLGMVFFGITTIISAAFLACSICKAKSIDLDACTIKDDFKNHVLRTIAVMFFATVVCWLPYQYLYYKKLHSADKAVNINVLALSTLFILLSGATKPVIYILMSSQFKKAVVRALKCCNNANKDYEMTHGFKMHVIKKNMSQKKLLLPESPTSLLKVCLY